MSDRTPSPLPDDSTGPPAGDRPRQLTLTEEHDSARPAEAGTPFASYVLLGRIAEGGMGVVYRALQTGLNRVVALKCISKGILATEAEARRFRAEAAVAAGLDHPHIVPVYEFGEWQEQLYFSMKYLPDGSLADRLKSGPLPARLAADWLATLAATVHFAHQRGVLHRDLKPANVLLTADPRGGDPIPVIADFGIAKRVGASDGLTITGVGVGTPEYMAPEQARSAKHVTATADVWSLGAILYECLTGRPPFRGESAMDTVIQAMTLPAPDPRTLNPVADPGLCEVALKCLEKEPNKRYATAHDLAATLGRHLAAGPTAPPAPARPTTRPPAAPVAPLVTAPVEASHWRGTPASGSVSPGRRPGDRLDLTLPGGQTLAFAWCPPGTFRMGSGPFHDEMPVHEVTLTKGFYLGVYEVTQAQWRAVTNTDTSRYSHSKGDRRPVEWVTWKDATWFCDKLRELTGRPVQLPTEAEWEYACRAGSITEYSWGDEPHAERMNCDLTPEVLTTDVGSYSANSWGLHDMHGNLWEWCRDAWDSYFYEKSPAVDPVNNDWWIERMSQDGSVVRVLRGGSWASNPRGCRAASRRAARMFYCGGDVGFRVSFYPD